MIIKNTTTSPSTIAENLSWSLPKAQIRLWPQPLRSSRIDFDLLDLACVRAFLGLPITSRSRACVVFAAGRGREQLSQPSEKIT